MWRETEGMTGSKFILDPYEAAKYLPFPQYALKKSPVQEVKKAISQHPIRNGMQIVQWPLFGIVWED